MKEIRSSAHSAAAPSLTEIPERWDAARVSTQVASHTNGLPISQGILPSSRIRLLGSRTAGALTLSMEAPTLFRYSVRTVNSSGNERTADQTHPDEDSLDESKQCRCLHRLNNTAQIAETISIWIIKVFLKPFLKYSQLFVLFLSMLTDKSDFYPKPAVIKGCESFDYIVVGGGTAGCVLANRLTEDPDISVLLIEAGGLPSLIADIPAFFPIFDYSTEEWGYYSTNDYYSSQGVKNGTVHMTAGKMLGGSSGVTYLLYVRGAKEDFDKWANMGNQGWDWNSVLPFFKKGEYIDEVDIYAGNTSSLHGKNGPLHVKKPDWDERVALYLKGFRENGNPTLVDINGNKTLGYGLAEVTTDEHFRQSTAITYIKPIKDRKNFSLLLNSLVTKIIFNKNKEAIGVEVMLCKGKTVTVYAKKEVIISAGALNSPKLLMLSGVGPKNHLKEKGIKVIVDSPNVGQNFRDTPLVLIVLTGHRKFMKSAGDNVLSLTSFHSFPTPLLLGHVAVDKSQCYADYQINAPLTPAGSIIPAAFCSSIFRYNDKTCISMIKDGIMVETLLAGHNLMYPASVGNVTLCSADPQTPPNIYTGYFSDPSDLDRHAKFVQDYVSVVNTETFKCFNSRIVEVCLEQCNHLEFNTLEYWKCYILNLAGPQWNFSGTCSMGVEGVGVVDNRLRVRGVKRLRVVDASVMPEPVTGNNVAVVVMIAEKASAMVKEDQQEY